jgi:hypothetical protein
MNSKMHDKATAAVAGESEWLDTARAAPYSGYSKSALEKLRVRGGGPAYSQRTPNGRVMYRKSDIDTWRTSFRRRSTSDQISPEMH